MQRITYILGVLIFTSSISYSQITNQEEPDPKSPEIEFRITEYNYDTIKRGANGTCEFEFKNTGKNPLILTDVLSTCGCTVPTWPKEPVKKNGKGKIIVNYDTKRIGSFNKTITVMSNASNSVIRLKIKGTVVI